MINLFRRRYLISLTYLLVVIIGIAAWKDIAMERMPGLNLPSITVTYSWGTTTPEVMEKEITRKVESAANRLRDVEEISSVSREGSSQINITFAKNAPVDYRVVELQEYLVGLREALPPNIRGPDISHQKPEELQEQENFLTYSISGDRPVRDLLEITRQRIRLPLLGLEGLDNIEILGADDPALFVEFDTDLIEKLNISPDQVLNEISSNMRWRSSGYFETGGQRISLLVPPQFEDIQEIRNLRIPLRNSSRLVRLAEIADVNVQDYPTTSLNRINGSPALIFRFHKKSGADALGLAEVIRSRIGEIRQSLPADIHIQLEQDVTEELRAQFGNLQFQAMISLLVVFLVLLLFIRRFRAPFVILGSIIFSILMSVGALYLIGYTLNIITLAGLTVALGMIIDNAVVVFEQVNPGLPESREDRLEHIKKFLPRALVPVFGSTLTTVGIFVPLFFAMEELQLFLVPLAVALTSTLIASLIISLTWIPYALIWLVPSSTQAAHRPHDSIRARAKEFFNRLVRRPLLLLFAWRRKLRWVFYLAFITTVGIPLFAIDEPDWDEGDTWWPEFTQVYFHNRTDIDPWIGGITYRFFNDTYFGEPWGGYNRQQTIRISIRTPQGTPLEEIDKMARNYERIAEPYEEAFSYYETSVNTGGGNSSASLTFYVKNDYLYRPEPYIFYFEAQYLAAGTGNSGISVYGLNLDGINTGFGSYISGQRITLTGYNYDQLLELARNLERRLKRNRRVQEVDIHGSGYSRGNMYQYHLRLKDEAMALRGLNRSRLLDALSLDLSPFRPAGKIELGGQSMYLASRNKSRTTYEEEIFREIRSVDSVTFTLDEVAELTRRQAMPSIQRRNQSYSRTVTVDFLGPYRLANDYISRVVEETPVPVGAKIEYGSSGFSFGRDEDVQNLLLLLGLTLLSVWMIVSALLESWLDPLVVILAVPLSLIGIMSGTLYHDLAFDRGAMAGTLLCVGVVVNNSILLMHEKQRYRHLGIQGIRSWLYVYKSKMRAVLITTLTTIGGLIPMIVFGESEFWESLATIVVWGLGGSTLLILLLMGVWEKERVKG